MARRPAIVDDSIKDEALPGMEGLPQDPTPAKRGPGRPKGSTTKKATPRIRARSSSGQVMSKAQLKAKVATEVYAFATLFVGMWGLKDPCAEVMSEEVQIPGHGTEERLAAIVTKVVDIMARNDAVLQFAATSGLIGEVGMLASLLWPVAKQVYSAHGPGGHGHEHEGNDVTDYDRYPAPALA